jgi:hypothetical protein
MKRITVFVTLSWMVAVAIILQAQSPSRFSPEAQKFARDVLSSPYSEHLSTMGRTALEIISGSLQLTDSRPAVYDETHAPARTCTLIAKPPGTHDGALLGREGFALVFQESPAGGG